MHPGPALLGIVLVALVISGLEPADRATWIARGRPGADRRTAAGRDVAARSAVAPARTWLLAGHALILMLGGHYTYARCRPASGCRRRFGLARNHYDRLGHFAQGFVPAILAREILLRQRGARARRLAVLPGHLRVPRIQRLLRAARVVDGARVAAKRRDRVPRHAGRRLGHAVGHVPGLVGALAAQLVLARAHDRSLREVSSMTRIPHAQFRPHPWHGLAVGRGSAARRLRVHRDHAVRPGEVRGRQATGYLRVDRPQRTSSSPPTLYGFIPRTYCGDARRRALARARRAATAIRSTSAW